MYPLLLSSSTGGLVNSDDEDDDEESSISSRPHSRNPSAAPNLGPTSTGSVRGTDGGGLDTAFFGKSGPDVNNAPAASVSNNALAATSIAVSNAHHSRPESAISKLFSVDRTKAKHGLLEVFAKKVWEGKLKRKRLFIHGEPAPKSKRSWKTVWAVLSSGGQLLMFEDWVWFESKRDLPITDRIPIDNSPLPKQGTPIPINGTIALYDPTFVTIKKPRPPRNAFRLYDLHGTSFMFRGESIEDCKEWILRLNYVAAFKYCGIRFSGGGSSVAGSNTVVAGGSTTSSFNIIVNSTHSYNNTAQQHQKQQISPISLENKTTSNYSMSFPAASSMCTPSVLASPPNQTGGILSSSLIAPHQASLSLAAHHHGDGNTVESNPPRERRRSILDMFELRNHHHTHPSPQSPPSTTAPLHGSSDGEQGSSEGISPHLEAAREAAIEVR